MIDSDKRQAIYILYKEGMGVREISRRRNIAVNTVSAIIKQNGRMPDAVREDKISINEPLLRELYNDCSGWVQRIHERLKEEYKILPII